MLKLVLNVLLVDIAFDNGKHHDNSLNTQIHHPILNVGMLILMP
jgi:hypothetical protein